MKKNSKDQKPKEVTKKEFDKGLKKLLALPPKKKK
jgi:hypothetical protein